MQRIAGRACLAPRLVRGAAVFALFLGVLPARAEDGDSYSLRQTIADTNAAISGEVLKSAAAQKSVLEGIAAYRRQAVLQRQAATLQRDMQQSGQLCQQVDSSDALAAGAQKARARAAAGQDAVSTAARRNTNTMAVLENSYKASNDSFCSEAEVAQGVCKPTANPKYANLAGADQDALYLFQSREGGDTYAGSTSAGQVDAVNAYISRVVYGGAPPQQLQLTKAAYNKNPHARAYVEMQRRYQAFLSMAAYTLNQIKESRTPAAK